MARVAALVPDLMLQSRVVEILGAAGYEVRTAADAAALDRVEDLDLIVADVNAVDPAAVCGHGAPVLGFHQHTDPGARTAAEEAGVALVVPRSRLVRELPDLAAQLIA